MIVFFLKVLFIYLKSLLLATFRLKGNKTLYLSGVNLMKRSFRLSQADNKNTFIVLRKFLAVSKKLFLAKKSNLKLTRDADFIYDVDLPSREIRQKYLQHYTGSAPSNYVSKENLMNELSFPVGIFICIFNSILFIPLFLLTFFSKKKAAVSLLFSEVTENAVLLYLVRKFKLKKCYFFSIYEKDANLAACLLMKEKTEVIKIPSEVPFYFFNRTIICDKLIICNAYQYDELKEYKDTLIYRETEFFGPERVTDFYTVYKDKSYTMARKTIGFYSTASWVREKEGHIDQGTSMVENEALLLGYLKKYLTQHPEYKLIIYAHPKEKSEKYLSETKIHYKELLGDVNFEFAEFSALSAASFFNAELAVAFNSTLVHERLYFGFKTLILPLNHPGFPVRNSSFNNICSYKEEELFLKMDKALQQSEDEFFEKNGLSNYCFKQN